MDNVAREDVTDIFGSNVFSDAVLRERLPKNVYKAIKRTIDEGEELDASLADVVANAMKDWAIQKGATHFCHWFQPMTGMTAEKHDSFISPTPDGRTIMEFSGRELIKGEPDASSFPSGGLRATFEARGYTAWDCTSPVFVRQTGDSVTLVIPSAFCSYTGEPLDKKTPLLRSMEALNKHTLRVLRAFGNTTSKRVAATLGAEQEYFLIDRKFYEKRLDLMLSGRTLFGAPSPKGQEMEDHYFGSIHERIANFMLDLNTELWRLGVSAKTQHNEVAPAQYEIAPVFATVNIATDHNQITMETLQRVARKHGMVCLMHEKPFAGVNGSGKHNNWSMVTDDGVNLLDPGTTPHENLQFLTIIAAVIRAVDVYARQLRSTVATAGNDHRLGANEAPPAIISIFLGELLSDLFEQLKLGDATSSKQASSLKLGVNTLPPLPKDCSDRNRTSPFAFTGNKFEFRMPGSSQSIAGINCMLNIIVTDILAEIADKLEKAKDVNEAAKKIITEIAKKHTRIIFNGNNYAEAWVKEAEERGLPNLTATVDALPAMVEKECIALFERHKVLTEHELYSRCEIYLETYSKQINIEAATMLSMGRRQILPAASGYAGKLAKTVAALEVAGSPSPSQKKLLQQVTKLLDGLQKQLDELESAMTKAAKVNDHFKHARAYHESVIPVMKEVRESADALESVIDASLWPLPTYAEMLFIR